MSFEIFPVSYSFFAENMPGIPLKKTDEHNKIINKNEIKKVKIVNKQAKIISSRAIYAGICDNFMIKSTLLKLLNNTHVNNVQASETTHHSAINKIHV